MAERDQGDELHVWQKVDAIWKDDPERFLTEFAAYLGEASDNAPEGEEKSLLLAAAEHLREAAFNIYALEK